jgi:hypothetical protein
MAFATSMMGSLMWGLWLGLLSIAAARTQDGEHGSKDEQNGNAGLLSPHILIPQLQLRCERDPQCEADSQRKPCDPGATP